MQTQDGKNFSVISTGSLSNIRIQTFSHEAVGSIKGKQFIKDNLNLTGMEVSLNVMPPNTSMPFYHQHKENEELYVFIKGQGQFQVDGTTFDVEEGSIVRVATGGIRVWRNTGSNDLYCIVIQAKENSLANGTISDGVGVDKTVEWPEEMLATPA